MWKGLLDVLVKIARILSGPAVIGGSIGFNLKQPLTGNQNQKLILAFYYAIYIASHCSYGCQMLCLHDSACITAWNNEMYYFKSNKSHFV